MSEIEQQQPAGECTQNQPPARCPNPYCDGTGWITCDATGTSNAYRIPACKVGPHVKS